MSLALLELQHAFRRATYAQDGTDIKAWIIGDSLSARARLDIYRRNIVTNLCNALRADYPVVERLVGEGFFRHAAQTYIAATPSTSGDLNDYGESFPEFLSTFAAANALPYLGDVARLEQAWKQSFFAADAAVIEFDALANLPPEDLGGLCFRLHPALRLVSSRYPILRIWCVNQPDVSTEEEVRLDEGGDWIVLRRDGTKVELQTVPQAEFVWLAALSEGRTLAEAVDAAFLIEENFPLAACLQTHIEQGSFFACTSGEKT